MKLKDFLTLVSIIFFVLGVAHLIRAINGSSVMVGNFSLPLWVSWVAVVVTLFLSYTAQKLKKSR